MLWSYDVAWWIVIYYSVWLMLCSHCGKKTGHCIFCKGLCWFCCHCYIIQHCSSTWTEVQCVWVIRGLWSPSGLKWSLQVFFCLSLPSSLTMSFKQATNQTLIWLLKPSKLHSTRCVKCCVGRMCYTGWKPRRRNKQICMDPKTLRETQTIKHPHYVTLLTK